MILSKNVCDYIEHPDDHMKDPELDADDVDEFENQELSDPELYQSLKTLAGRTRNEHAVEFENPDDLGDREILIVIMTGAAIADYIS